MVHNHDTASPKNPSSDMEITFDQNPNCTEAPLDPESIQSKMDDNSRLRKNTTTSSPTNPSDSKIPPNDDNKLALSHMREGLRSITVLTKSLRAKLKTLRDEAIRDMVDTGKLPEDLAELQACTLLLQEESLNEEGCNDELVREKVRGKVLEDETRLERADTKTLEDELALLRREVERERISFTALSLWSAVLLALAWWATSACGQTHA